MPLQALTPTPSFEHSPPSPQAVPSAPPQPYLTLTGNPRSDCRQRTAVQLVLEIYASGPSLWCALCFVLFLVSCHSYEKSCYNAHTAPTTAVTTLSHCHLPSTIATFNVLQIQGTKICNLLLLLLFKHTGPTTVAP